MHKETPGPTSIMDIIDQNRSIFFGPSAEKQQLLTDCLREAKTELISDILEIERKHGKQPTGADFDRLYELSIEELHAQIITTQDKYYFCKH